MIHSKQRELILDTLRSCRIHPTADELHTLIRSSGNSSLSLATVYRNLRQLADAGRVARIPVPGSADRFDPVPDGHFHMICEKCGRIVDVPASAVPDICPAAQKATGCPVTGCVILFRGLCPDCK